MTSTVVPFTIEHVDDAARLLAARHAAQRRHEALLDPAYESASTCAAAIAELAQSSEASGAVVLGASGPTAFVLGAPREAAWGDHMWVTAVGHATRDPEALRDAYALAAQRWYDEGRMSHYALVPTYDGPALDAWYRLGFGQMHVHATRESASITPTISDGVLRTPTRDDIDQIVELEFVVPDHQARSPVFSGGQSWTAEQLRADWEDDIDDPKFRHFVIERDGVLLALGTACAATVSSMHSGLVGAPDGGFLGHAAVRPEGRGRGYGRALGEAAINWAYEQGFASVVNDWRVTNLLASRTWPRLGWRPTFLRLHRRIGPAG